MLFVSFFATSNHSFVIALEDVGLSNNAIVKLLQENNLQVAALEFMVQVCILWLSSSRNNLLKLPKTNILLVDGNNALSLRGSNLWNGRDSLKKVDWTLFP